MHEYLRVNKLELRHVRLPFIIQLFNIQISDVGYDHPYLIEYLA